MAALRALVGAICASLLLASPSGAELVLSPDAVAIYDDANEQLAQLLIEREVLAASIVEATSAERVSLGRFGAVEGTLARLVDDRRENARRREDASQRLSQVEARAPALDAHAAGLDRQLAGHERWLLEGERPRLTGSRAYRSTLDARVALSEDRAAATRAAAAVRAEEVTEVLDLGRLNTEISFWEREADALSRQVGTHRARALGAHARLGEIQKSGLELSEAISAQLAALRRAGYLVGASFASDGRTPVAEPIQWPAQPARGYVLPIGSPTAGLRASEPLQRDSAASRALTLPAQTWVLPVRGSVTTPYGDATPYQPAHWAIDVGSRLYEPVRAAADGVADFVGLAAGDNRLASYGMVVVIRHDDRLMSLYAHLDDRAFGGLVQPGEAVKQGQVIGHVGLTGNTTGPHVHFEVRFDGRPIDPLLLVNPASP
ncbi:MAG: peptidoglycan DD-metalloendopeptidase family protein [Chloroflexota bacterium]